MTRTARTARRSTDRRRASREAGRLSLLVPVDGYFEWQKLDASGKKKEPYAIAMKSGEPFAMAGIWEDYADNRRTHPDLRDRHMRAERVDGDYPRPHAADSGAIRLHALAWAGKILAT